MGRKFSITNMGRIFKLLFPINMGRICKLCAIAHQHGAQSLCYCPSNMGRKLCAIAHPLVQFISVRVTAPMSMTLKNVSLTSVIIDGAY